MRKFIDLSKLKKTLGFKTPKWSLKSNELISESKLKQVIGNERKLIYSPEAKKNISENKTIVKSFLELFKMSLTNARRISPSEIKLYKTILLHSGKKITVSLKELKNVSDNSYHTNNFFLFSIGSKNKSKKFFVKFVHDSVDIRRGFNGINEIIALDVIKSAGYNVVPAHLSYVDYVKNKSFIFYEFQDKLIDAEKAYREKLISRKDVVSIRRKLRVAHMKINRQIEKYDKIPINQNATIHDVLPDLIKSFESIPVFVDLKTKKLFIYDPWMDNGYSLKH